VIEGGTFRLVGTKFGSGIGSGEVQTGSNAASHIGRMELWNGTFVTQGFVGMGATPLGTVGELVFGHGASSHVEVDCGAVRPFCFSATSMSINQGTVRATANTTYMIDPIDAHGARFTGGWFVGTYRGHSLREHIYGSPMIHLTSIELKQNFYILVVSPAAGEGFTVRFDSGWEKGLLLGVPAAGSYEIEVRQLIGDTSEGNLCHGTKRKFEVGNDEALFDNVMLCSEAASRGALTPGGKAGVSIAVIVVVAAAALLVWWFVLRKPKVGDGYVEPETPAAADGYTA
jgi:hypothetical protein